MDARQMMLEHFTPLLGVAISVALYAAPWSDVAVVRASGAPKSSIVPGNLAVYLAATVTGAVYASLLGDRYYFMATAPGAMAFSFYVACAAPFSLQPEPRPRVSSVVALTSCSLCLVGALVTFDAPFSRLVAALSTALFQAAAVLIPLLGRAEQIHVGTAMCALACSLLWVVYGTATQELVVLGTNALAALCTSLQLLKKSRQRWQMSKAMIPGGSVGDYDFRPGDHRELVVHASDAFPPLQDVTHNEKGHGDQTELESVVLVDAAYSPFVPAAVDEPARYGGDALFAPAAVDEPARYGGDVLFTPAADEPARYGGDELFVPAADEPARYGGDELFVLPAADEPARYGGDELFVPAAVEPARYGGDELFVHADADEPTHFGGDKLFVPVTEEPAQYDGGEIFAPARYDPFANGGDHAVVAAKPAKTARRVPAPSPRARALAMRPRPLALKFTPKFTPSISAPRKRAPKNLRQRAPASKPDPAI